MSVRAEVADFWDEHTRAWLAGEDPMPDPLPRWYASYTGRGAGAVTREGFAEPYGGDLRGQARVVTLGLNPGRAELDFQARRGIFAGQLRSGSYSAWARSWPYLSSQWERSKGRNRYTRSRLEFGRRWFEDPALAPDDVLLMELYPWHSTRVTAKIIPPPEIIDRFIWQPLAEHPPDFIFAFGKDWLEVCRGLRLPEVGRWGQGGLDIGSTVASRAVAAFALPSQQWVVVCWQSGYAGPPGSEDTRRIREALTAVR